MTTPDSPAGPRAQPADAAAADDGTLWSNEWWKYVAANAAALVLAVSILASVWLLARPLALIFFGVVIAAALAPIARRLERMMPRALVALVIVFFLLLVIIALFALLIPAAADDAALFRDRIPEVVEETEHWLYERGVLRSDSSLQDQMSVGIEGLFPQLVTVPLTIFSGVIDSFLVFVIALYLMIEAHNIRDFALSLVAPAQREGFLSVADEMLRESGAYVRGVMIQSLMIGGLSYVGFLLIGLDFPLLLAIIMGVTEVFPIIGPIFGGSVAVVAALLVSPTAALLTAAFAIVLQQLEGNLITPYVMHKQVAISPLMVVVAVFAGGAVGGITGALIAIPLTASLRVFVVRVVAPAIRRKTGAAE